jgi:hypothetical protein
MDMNIGFLQHWHGSLDIFFSRIIKFLNNVIVIKTKVLLPQAYILINMTRPFEFCFLAFSVPDEG